MRDDKGRTNFKTNGFGGDFIASSALSLQRFHGAALRDGLDCIARP
jgi:hypothetical protein